MRIFARTCVVAVSTKSLIEDEEIQRVVDHSLKRSRVSRSAARRQGKSNKAAEDKGLSEYRQLGHKIGVNKVLSEKGMSMFGKPFVHQLGPS